MAPLLPNPRYEKKFIARGFTLAEVLARIRLHPSAFREAYPPRIVNNIYLDSPSRGITRITSTEQPIEARHACAGMGSGSRSPSVRPWSES